MATKVLYEGYLTKSPPEHKINRARWCKRYFQLCNCEGEIFLQYFKDNTCSKLKGTIYLRECEQVDQGLSFETKSKLKDAHIFDIVTQRRKYFLVTETEDEMLRWVHSICTACGFMSDDSISNVSDQTDGPVSPSRVAETPLNAGPRPMTTTTQPPVSNGNDSYINIADCETGNAVSASNGLPPKLNTKSSLPQQVPPAKQKGYDTMSSTSSSAPSDSAPSPPDSRPTSQIDGGIDADIYDIPPVRQADDAPPVPLRPAATLEDTSYKVVPGTKDPTSFKFDRQISLASSNRGSFSNSDDMGPNQTYDMVPSFNDRRSSGFESVESNGPQRNSDTPPPRPPPPPAVTEDIYQVPPSRQSLEADTDAVYDVPPTSPQFDSTYDILPSPLQKTPMQNIPSHLKTSEQISKSTDDLARSFEEISQQNANQSFTNGDLQHSTYDPVPAMDLNASIGSNCSINSVFKEMGASSSAVEAPPRPSKPRSMYPSTPPPSMDETYVAPTQPNHRCSPQEIRRRLTSIEARNPPPMANHQHQWMDQVIPVKYVNTKRSNTAVNPMARPNSSFSPKGYIPMRSNTVSSGSRGSMGFQNGQSGPVNGQHPPGSYMAMQGSSDSPKGGLGAPIREESYMHMQSQNDGPPEMYTMMNSSAQAIPPVPRRPPRQSTSSIISVSSTASGDSIPPPVDRRTKPRSTDSAILNPELLGMEGSFYATGPELPSDFPVQSPRTKSFSKRPSRHRERESCDFPRTPPRPHRSMHSSSSSHTDHERQPSIDDAYVFSDPKTPPPSKPRMETRHASIDTAIHAHPSPTLPPRSHTVEYLELDHDSDSPATLPRPPKPTSPKDQVEYIHLDLEKTKALQEVTQNREESKRDGGTLKK